VNHEGITAITTSIDSIGSLREQAAIHSPADCATVNGFYNHRSRGFGISVDFVVAISAKRDEIFWYVIAQQASRTNMVDLETIGATAILAPPAIPFQHMGAELAVGILVEPKPRFSLPN
jgi:thiamine monophosphate kinase